MPESNPPHGPMRRAQNGFSRMSLVGVVILVICLAWAGGMMLGCASSPPQVTATAQVEARATDTTQPTVAPTEPPPATNTPAPLPTEFSGESLAVQGVTDYVDSMGALNVIGDVANHSGQNAKSVEIIATFYDGNEQLVATETGHSSLDIVEAGGRSPFEVIVAAPPEGIESYELDLEWQMTDERPLTVELVSDVGWIDSARIYHVEGEVRNSHEFAVESVEIIGTFYNGADEVVRVESAFANLGVLEAGQTSKVEIVLLSPSASMERYELHTQAARR